MFALFVGLFGFFCSQMWQRYFDMKQHNEVGEAVRSLREKGYIVTLDRLNGFDIDTQTEMERVRSFGYTVLDKNGKPIDSKSK
ncbi:hypothetical protein [Vibrio sp. 10N.239.312.D08]|uniref:hypothetical protein n=1 Tax=Vibrio sp. 10N.239.312.D08 TaxID=3229978 RepID=UPI0035528DE6